MWEKDPEWLLPPLWRSEFLNVLTLAVRTELLEASGAPLVTADRGILDACPEIAVSPQAFAG